MCGEDEKLLRFARATRSSKLPLRSRTQLFDDYPVAGNEDG